MIRRPPRSTLFPYTSSSDLTLNDLGIETEAPIEVAFWTNEEGSRFVPVMMGSGVYAGAFTLAHALAAQDAAGLSVQQALPAPGPAGSPPASVADGAPRYWRVL